MSLEVREGSEALRADGLGDVLERVLDKGVVIAGDISLAVVGVELLTIKLRLVIASTERAEAIGIDWWRHDPYLSSRATARPRAIEALDDTLARMRDDGADGEGQSLFDREAGPVTAEGRDGRHADDPGADRDARQGGKGGGGRVVHDRPASGDGG